MYLNGTFAANITLGSGRAIEYGQGANVAVACSGSSSVLVTPKSSFVNAANGTGTHYLQSIQVLNIPANCNGVDFVLNVYGNSGNSPLNIFNTSSREATIWDSDDGFVIGANTVGTSIQSGEGNFTISFDSPTATSATSAKITLQTKPHSSCLTNANILCSFNAIQASYPRGLQIATSRDSKYIYVLDFSSAIYKSEDSGKSWAASLANSVSNTISASRNGQYLVAANSSVGGGVWMSSNFGTSWTQNFPSATAADKQFATARVSEDGTSVVATLSGTQSGKIFYSRNFGSTWSSPSVRGHASVGANGKNDGAINQDGTVMAVAMQNSNFYRSIDSGVTWDTQTTISGASTWSAFMDAQGSFMGSIKTGASIWTSLNANAASPTWVNKVTEAPDEVYVCRDDPSRLAYNSNSKLYLSVDQGKNWVWQSNVNLGRIWGVSFNGDCSRIYLLSDDDKLYVSNG